MNMKTIACLTASIAATAAFADIEVQLGVTEVTSAFTNTIVAVPYTGFEAGKSITVSNVVKTANLVAGDMCYVMSSADGLYEAWELKNKSGILQWEEVNQVQVKKDGTIEVKKSASPCTTELTPGTALWISRKGARSSALNTTPFYLWGTYDSANIPSTTVYASKNGTWNLVANCGSTAISVAQLITKIGSNAKNGDQIVVPNEKQGVVFFRGISAWGAASLQSTTMIQPGMGCWLKAKSGTDESTSFTISWVNE